MLNVAFINVGQGDTTVVWNSQTREAIVVDCLNPVAVWDLLQRVDVQRVRAVVVTHLHADHYAELVAFLKGCQPRGIEWDAVYFEWPKEIPRRILDDDDKHSQADPDNPSLQRKKTQSLYQTLAAWMSEPGNKWRHKSPDFLDGINIPGMRLEKLHPISGDIGRLMESGKLNNISVVLRISNGESSVLLTGDLEPGGWDFLAGNFSDLSSGVLKFPHHGAWKRDDVKSLLDRVCPEIVVMSVGTVGEKYGHPNPHVFEALRQRPKTTVLCTQATSQCTLDPTDVQEKVETILASVDSKFNGMAASKGCPCASTIIIELDDQARIIYPPPSAHLQIIAQCFPSAQCPRALKQ